MALQILDTQVHSLLLQLPHPSQAANREQLKNALIEAADNDRKILVEETIIGREVECAVLGNLDVKASGVGEILSADEFYDFDAKYYNSESKTLVDPPMPENMREQIREDAVKLFLRDALCFPKHWIHTNCSKSWKGIDLVKHNTTLSQEEINS